MTKDSDVVVLNIWGDFVDFIFSGVEIKIISCDPRDTEDTCYVTTWGNILKKNKDKFKYSVN